MSFVEIGVIDQIKMVTVDIFDAIENTTTFDTANFDKTLNRIQTIDTRLNLTMSTTYSDNPLLVAKIK